MTALDGGAGTSGAGAASGPFSGGSGALGSAVLNLADRIPARGMIIAGILFLAASSFWLARVDANLVDGDDVGVRDARERLFEFAGEAKRRQDLIRHGKFTQAWGFKAATEAHKVLMPIPQPQIDANPLLVQNPGY